MLLRKTDDYENSEGEITLLSALAGFGVDFGMSLFEPIPFVDLALNSIESWLKYGSFTLDDIFTNTYMEMLNDVVSNAGTLAESWGAGENVVANGDLTDLIFSVAPIFGIPIKNFASVIMMPIKIFSEIEAGGGYAGEFARLAVTHKLYETKEGKKRLTADGVDVAARAYLNDTEAYAAIVQELRESGCDTSNASTRIKNKVKKIRDSRKKK